jgi:hypothetical protein
LQGRGAVVSKIVWEFWQRVVCLLLLHAPCPCSHVGHKEHQVWTSQTSHGQANATPAGSGQTWVSWRRGWRGEGVRVGRCPSMPAPPQLPPTHSSSRFMMLRLFMSAGCRTQGQGAQAGALVCGHGN